MLPFLCTKGKLVGYTLECLVRGMPWDFRALTRKRYCQPKKKERINYAYIVQKNIKDPSNFKSIFI